MKTQRAVKTLVQIGHLSVDGYMLPDGTLGMSQAQLVSLINADKRNWSRYIKSKVAQTLNLSTFELVAAKQESTTVGTKSLKIVPLDYIVPILTLFALKGNHPSLELIGQLAGLGLHQIFCDAFKVKFEQEERQAWLSERQDGKQVRREFTDAIKWYIDNGKEVNYGLLTLETYKNTGLLSQYNRYDGKKFRDTLSEKELTKLKDFELVVATYIQDLGMEPVAAMQVAGKRYINK